MTCAPKCASGPSKMWTSLSFSLLFFFQVSHKKQATSEFEIGEKDCQVLPLIIRNLRQAPGKEKRWTTWYCKRMTMKAGRVIILPSALK